MTSQTPIRSMSHRGPLATPSTSSSSDRSSPCSTWSASPTNTSSHCSPPSMDFDIFQPRSPTLHAFTNRRHPRSLRRFSRKREARQGALLKSHFRTLQLDSEVLVHQASDLVKSLIVALTFCMMFSRLFYLTSCASRPPNSHWISKSYLPLPSSTRYLRCQLNLSLCEPRAPQAAVLHFLSEQIQHAKALSSLSASLSLPLRTFRETHHTLISRNLTDLLETPLLDFTPTSFIGKTFSLALDELDNVLSDPAVLYDSETFKEFQDLHSHAIYYRTTSNLLLEYSAARRQMETLLQHIQALHQKLVSLLPHRIWERPDIPRRYYTRCPTATTEDGLRAYIAALGATMDNVRLLSTSLDRIAEQLAQTTLENVLTPGRRTGFSPTVTSLQELFAQPMHLPIIKRFKMQISPLRHLPR